jgi:hypothetical protein
VPVAALDQEHPELFVTIDPLHPPIGSEGTHPERRRAVQRLSERGSMKKLIGVTILALSITCFAQAPVPDGSLNYNFGGPLAGYFLLGLGSQMERSVSFMVGGGKFWQGPLDGPTPSQPFDFRGLHQVKFRTGPVLNQQPPYDYSSGARFAAGGHFSLTSEVIPFLFCGTIADATACTYHAKWVWAALDRLTLSDGTCIYTFRGELIGTYFDPPTGTVRHVRAFYEQPSLDQNNPFGDGDGQQSWGAGTLQVILQVQ